MASGDLLVLTDRPTEGYRLLVTATKVDPGQDSVRLRVITNRAASDTAFGEEISAVEFTLNYYSMPFIDNTRLHENARYAITLKQVGVTSADGQDVPLVEIAATFFPESFMSSRDRPYLDEMLWRLNRPRG